MERNEARYDEEMHGPMGHKNVTDAERRRVEVKLFSDGSRRYRFMYFETPSLPAIEFGFRMDCDGFVEIDSDSVNITEREGAVPVVAPR